MAESATLCEKLSTATSVAELDALLVHISTLVSSDSASSLEKEEKLLVADKIKEILDVGDDSLTSNAKIRRRLKRTQQLLEDSKPVPIVTPLQPVVQQKKQQQKKEPEQEQQRSYTLPEVIKLFETATSMHDVEKAMNGVKLPEDKENADFTTCKEPLKQQLKKVLETHADSINKMLRRRIQRLVFVLSSTKEQEELTATSKIQAQKNITKEEALRKEKEIKRRKDMENDRKNDTIQGAMYVPPPVAPVPIPIEPAYVPSADDSKSFEICLAELNAGFNNVEAIEAAIGGRFAFTTFLLPTCQNLYTTHSHTTLFILASLQLITYHPIIPHPIPPPPHPILILFILTSPY